MSTPLRFVDAEKLDTPAGSLTDIELVSHSDAALGTLDGMVINPAKREVCYYVVRSRGLFSSHRYLLPATVTQFETDRRALRVDVEPDELALLPETDSQAFPPFSDTDVVDAMFASRPH